jgi:hypothetical protein
MTADKTLGKETIAMSLTIELRPETERWVHDEAARAGTTPDHLIAGIVERSLPARNGAAPDLAEEFQSLVEWWERDTAPLSSIEQMAMHPAYQRVIGMGKDVVPLILRKLQVEPDHWFWALKAITGENPMKREHAGKLKLMAEDWLRWGAAKGLIGQDTSHA